MSEVPIECPQELVLAVFRLAVSDRLGIAYGHDSPTRQRPVPMRHGSDAERFLMSRWAEHLGEIAGIPTRAVRSHVLELSRPAPVPFQR